MPQTLKITSRMDAIQAPIIAVIGDIIRQTPGTISLGQGVVHYGPPPAALTAAAGAVAEPEHARVSAGFRPAGAHRARSNRSSDATTASTSRAAAA